MIAKISAFDDPVQEYKNKTKTLFNAIDGMTLSDVLESIEFFVEEFVKEYNLYSDEKLIVKDTLIIGSRSRGKEKSNSDLDVLLIYDGPLKEDHVFNVINAEDFPIGDVVVDFNPIKVEDAPDWLRRAEEYLKEK